MARRKREFLTPELTPLIDVVFLLLIFFLVSSVFKKDESVLDLTLPTTQEGVSEKMKKEDITIEITNESFALNGAKLSKAELVEKLKAYESTSNINLKADKETKHQNFVSVLEILHKQNKQNISIITQDNN